MLIIYKVKIGYSLNVKATHAGLKCGVFSSGIRGWTVFLLVLR